MSNLEKMKKNTRMMRPLKLMDVVTYAIMTPSVTIKIQKDNRSNLNLTSTSNHIKIS